MEIRSYSWYILINCVLLFPSFPCKSVSLNDIIAAEKQSLSLQTPQLEVSETNTNIRELPRDYKILTLTKHVTSGTISQTNKKISPIRYKKTFQIRSPLRPKKIKYSNKSRRGGINTTAKREIDNNEKFNRNYVPLLKSLSVLFNNILRTDSGEINVPDEYYNKRQSNSENEECSCAYMSKSKIRERVPPKKATSITSFISSTIPPETKTIDLAETSSASTYNSTDDNVSSFRRHKDISILPTRNSISTWRNYNGLGEGGLSTYYRNIEGNIARNNGSDESNNSGRETTSHAENYKQYTSGSSRDDESCNGFSRVIRRNKHITPSTENKAPTTETIAKSNETFGNDRGDSNTFKGFNNFETGRNETESRILISQSSSRLRRLESKEETTEIAWQIEGPKESSFDVTYNYTKNQRLFNRDSSLAPKDQGNSGANKKLTLNDLTTTLLNTSRSNLPQDKQKVVVIYDGYSIARDVNGENKLSEKAYRILF